MASRRRNGTLTTLVLGAAGALALALPAGGEPVHTQTIPLDPGWNAIYLEVTPDPPDTASVFAGLPVRSVWQWDQSLGRVQFIEDPAEGLLNRDATDAVGSRLVTWWDSTSIPWPRRRSPSISRRRRRMPTSRG